MRATARILVCVALLGLQACASAKVPSGAAIGALSGAAACAGVGVLISDEKLLGSSANERTGDTSLPPGGSIAAGAAIGAVLGAIVGAMVGHHQEHPYGERPPVPLPGSDAAEEAAEQDEQAQRESPRAF